MNDLLDLLDAAWPVAMVVAMMWYFERRTCLRIMAIWRRNRWPGEKRRKT
jgi:hypothetical protein